MRAQIRDAGRLIFRCDCGTLGLKRASPKWVALPGDVAVKLHDCRALTVNYAARIIRRLRGRKRLRRRRGVAATDVRFTSKLAYTVRIAVARLTYAPRACVEWVRIWCAAQSCGDQYESEKTAGSGHSASLREVPVKARVAIITYTLWRRRYAGLKLGWSSPPSPPCSLGKPLALRSSGSARSATGPRRRPPTRRGSASHPLPASRRAGRKRGSVPSSDSPPHFGSRRPNSSRRLSARCSVGPANPGFGTDAQSERNVHYAGARRPFWRRMPARAAR